MIGLSGSSVLFLKSYLVSSVPSIYIDDLLANDCSKVRLIFLKDSSYLVTTQNCYSLLNHHLSYTIRHINLFRVAIDGSLVFVAFSVDEYRFYS